jgi:hypothetical protein
MPPAPHKTPLDPRPPAGTKLPVGHSKLSAPKNSAQRPPLASPPSCRAERITLSIAWLQRANPLANNSPMLRTSPKIHEADGHYLPLAGSCMFRRLSRRPPAFQRRCAKRLPLASPAVLLRGPYFTLPAAWAEKSLQKRRARITHRLAGSCTFRRLSRRPPSFK